MLRACTIDLYLLLERSFTQNVGLFEVRYFWIFDLRLKLNANTFRRKGENWNVPWRVNIKSVYRDSISIVIWMFDLIGNFFNAVHPRVHQIVRISQTIIFSFNDCFASKPEFDDASSNLWVENNIVLIVHSNLHIWKIIFESLAIDEVFSDLCQHFKDITTN